MKTSLKSLSATMKPQTAPKAAAAPEEAPKNYRTAETRVDTRQLSGHFPAEDVKAFKRMALEQDMDVQEMLAEALNMAFERFGQPNRLNIVSGRRKR
jgi:hypothetical protein